jgi:hypothetical protein
MMNLLSVNRDRIGRRMGWLMWRHFSDEMNGIDLLVGLIQQLYPDDIGSQ